MVAFDDAIGKPAQSTVPVEFMCPIAEFSETTCFASRSILMPLFFFDMDDRDPDQIGVDLPSVIDARNEATRLVSNMAKDHPEALWDRGEWRLTVTDDERLSLFQLVIVTIDAPVLIAAGHTPGTALVRRPSQMANGSKSAD